MVDITSNVTYTLPQTISNNGIYKIKKIPGTKLPSGETTTDTYEAFDIESGTTNSFESLQEAQSYVKQNTPIGYTDESGVKTNSAPQSYNTNGTPKEVKPPKAPTAVPNSGPKSQMNGSSLPKPAQGVIYKTITDVNNALPVAGCPIKLPALLTKLETKLQLFTETETNRVKEWAKKLGEFIDPIVEMIMKGVEAIKWLIKQIQDFIKEIMEVIQEIQKWIKDTIELINFIMSLPSRLMQLIMNCMNKLMQGVTNYISQSFEDFSAGFKEGLDITIPINATSSNTA